jgi:hypothetical protein
MSGTFFKKLTADRCRCLLGFGWWIWVVVATIEAAAVGLKGLDRKVTNLLARNIR